MFARHAHEDVFERMMRHAHRDVVERMVRHAHDDVVERTVHRTGIANDELAQAVPCRSKGAARETGPKQA
jgi:hypothetical protein